MIQLKVFEELMMLYKIKYHLDCVPPNEEERLMTMAVNLVAEYKRKNSDIFIDKKEQTEKTDIITKYDSIKDDVLFSYKGIFSKELSCVGKILSSSIKERGVVKNEMLDLEEKNTDRLRVIYLSGTEKYIKEVMNSTYGVTGEKNFFMFNPVVASSITKNSSEQLKILISQIEKIFGGRVIIRNFNELFNYISLNVSTPEEIAVIESLNLPEDQFQITTDSFLKRINLTFKLSAKERSIVDSMLESIFSTKAGRIRFHFLNNFDSFLKDLDSTKDILLHTKDNLFSPTDYNEKAFVKDLNESYIVGFRALVFDKFIQNGQTDLCSNYDRSCVLMSDTDSIFVKMHKMATFLEKFTKENEDSIGVIEDPQMFQAYLFRYMSYLFTSITTSVLDIVVKEHYNSINKGEYIYKSEFLYRKILLFKTKKTYGGIVTIKEGRKVPMYLDKKNIEKVSYSRLSTKYAVSLLNEIVDVNKDFSYSNIFKLVDESKQNILNLIDTGDSVPYGKPVKYKNESNYKDALTNSTFLACHTYNELFPLAQINSGEKCVIIELNLPKLKIKDEQEKIDAIINFYKEMEVSDEIIEFVERNLNDIGSKLHEHILKNCGIPYIALPASNTEHISHFRKLINREKTIQNNIDNRGINFLEAIGIYTFKNTNVTEISNIVRFR